MPDLFDKFTTAKNIHGEICRELGVDPFGIRMEQVASPTHATIEGRKCILLGSNNYLGLTFNPAAIGAACAAASSDGIGTTGSRVANGSYSGHLELEAQVARFFGRGHAILFTTGYQANAGFLSSIAGHDDTILIDAECHASIYDGCRLGDATVLHFRHNDAADLERRLRRLPAGTNKLVVTEGIFSMRGDRAPLGDLVAVAEAHGAYIAVDEAHSIGVLGGNGRGLAEECGIEDRIDFVLGTFSKSVGTIGGFCVSDNPNLEAVRLAARAYLFTASLPPPVVAAARANLEQLHHGRELRGALWRNADRLYDGLAAMDFDVGPDKTPVIGVVMPSIEVALRMWKALFLNGVYVNLALPPATPRGVCLLRCSVSAAHTAEQIETALEAFSAARKALNRKASAA